MEKDIFDRRMGFLSRRDIGDWIVFIGGLQDATKMPFRISFLVAHLGREDLDDRSCFILRRV